MFPISPPPPLFFLHPAAKCPDICRSQVVTVDTIFTHFIPQADHWVDTRSSVSETSYCWIKIIVAFGVPPDRFEQSETLSRPLNNAYTPQQKNKAVAADLDSYSIRMHFQ